jgi:hypothetical protein
MLSDTNSNELQSRARPDVSFAQAPLALLTRSADNLPQFEVFVLGTKAAGKTVLLAALYQYLSAQDNRGNGFRLSCDNSEQLRALNSILDDLQSPQNLWPDSSFTESTFNFKCVHTPLNGEPISLFRFNYVDYPGGYITTEPEKIDEYVRRAHSILVLLDGQKIYDRLTDADGGGPNIYADLDKIVPVLSSCIGRPIHFLITKSDLFDFEVQTLDKITGVLLRHANLQNVVEQLCDRGIVHIVPVSAIGRNFATYAGGRMKRKPGARLEPFYVDLSIGLTLMDQIRVFRKFGSSNQRGPLKRLGLIRMMNRVVAELLKMKQRVTEINTDSVFSIFTAMIPINIEAVLAGYEKCLQQANARLSTTITGLEEEIKRLTESIRDQDSALTAIVQIQAARVAAFEKKFPASNLDTASMERRS